MTEHFPDLEARAVSQHARWCRQHHVIFDQPSTIEVVGDRVVLTNVRGLIAEFEIIRRGGIERLRRARAPSSGA
jgi:hypothetical protein